MGPLFKMKHMVTLFLLATFIIISIFPLGKIDFYHISKGKIWEGISGNLKKERHGANLSFASACGKLQFSRKTLPITALASFPGSGSTWLRHLIQEASGIFTGSVYGDRTPFRKGFPGEKTKDGQVIVIKTQYNPGKIIQPQQAVLLIRNPFHALIADFNSQFGHEAFNRKKWDHYLLTKPKAWYLTNSNWLEFKREVLVITYEDLKANLLRTMKILLEFLDTKVSKKRLDCAIENQEGDFHRRKHNYSLFRFPKERVKKIKEYVAQINQTLSAKFKLSIQGYDP